MPTGNFELWIGPDEHPGNWLATPAGCDTIVTRQFFGDWDNEQRASFEIELVSPIPADARTDLLDRHARPRGAPARGRRRVARGQHQVLERRRGPGPGGPLERLRRRHGEVRDGWRPGEHQRLGALRTGSRRGLDRRSDSRPKRAYWSLHIGNFWWESLDYASRHTSLNHHQAVLDDDGVFRAVVAHRDPGVPNWLDTMGHTKGPLLFRWVVADHGPAATTQIVPFDEIRDHLPPGPRP